MIGLLIASVAAGVLLLAGLRAVGAPILSPGVVGVAFYVVIGGLGAIAATAHAYENSGAAHYVLAYAIRTDTILIFAGIAGAFGAGAMLAQLVVRHRAMELPDLTAVTRDLAAHTPGPVVLSVAIVPLVLELLGLGPAVVRASQYLQSDGPSFAFKLGGTIAPIGFLASAFLAVAPDRRHRRAGQLLCLAYSVVLFSTATRALGMLPLLWLLIVEGLGVGGSTSRRVTRVFGMFFLTYLGFAAALVSRGLDNHGLIPYVTYFAHHPTSVFLAPAVLSENLLFAYPLTSFVMHVAPAVTQHDIATSLNPLPGSMTDWPSIAPLLRAHPFIPFNTIGEVFRFSPAFGLVYFALAGFLFQYAAAALMSTGSPRLRLTVALAVLAAAAFFMVTTLEYNTRVVTRTLWLVLLVVVATEVWHTIQAVRRRSLWRPDFSTTI
jgi:hypothetical protein